MLLPLCPSGKPNLILSPAFISGLAACAPPNLLSFMHDGIFGVFVVETKKSVAHSDAAAPVLIDPCCFGSGPVSGSGGVAGSANC